jgi:hypothetical protein
MKTSNSKIIQVNPNSIAEHPLIHKLPRWSEENPELLALRDDIKGRGIDQPLTVILEGRSPDTYLLVDGRHRLAAAKLVGLDKVPVVIRDEAGAADIILHSLINRRHYTKGALAYLSYLVVCQKAVANGGDRKSEFTKSTLISVEDLCGDLGFSRETYFQAKQIHEAFAKNPEMREKFEPSILEGAGLGGILAGIGAWGTSDHGDALKSKRECHDQLFLVGFEKATGHLKPQFWKKLSVKARAEVMDKTAQMVREWPAELAEVLIPVLKAKLTNK